MGTVRKKLNRLLTLLTPILGAGAVGACPLCWAGSASLLAYLGLGSLIPVWHNIVLGLILLSIVGFLLDFRSHKNIAPLLILIFGSVLLLLGRYIFAIQTPQHIFGGIQGFAGWPIWGTGVILIFIAIIYNKRLFKNLTHKSYGRI